MYRGRYTPGYGPGPGMARGHYKTERPPCAAGHCHHGGGSLGRTLRDAAGIALTAYAVRRLTGYHDWGCSNCGRDWWY